MENVDWTNLISSSSDLLAGIVIVAILIERGYLYLKREYLREVKRADEAEAKADKYENLLLKSRNVVNDAVHSHEEIVEDLLELARRHTGGAV